MSCILTSCLLLSSYVGAWLTADSSGEHQILSIRPLHILPHWGLVSDVWMDICWHEGSSSKCVWFL